MVEQDVIRAIQGIQPSITFMISDQNSPVPQHVFCLVSALGNTFVDTPLIDNDEFQEEISKTSLYRISLTYHGLVTSSAYDAAQHMAAYLESFKARLNFKDQGYSIIRVNDIQKIPMLKDVDMYATYVLDFSIATVQGHKFDIDVIDNVNIYGDLEETKYEIEVKI